MWPRTRPSEVRSTDKGAKPPFPSHEGLPSRGAGTIKRLRPPAGSPPTFPFSRPQVGPDQLSPDATKLRLRAQPGCSVLLDFLPSSPLTRQSPPSLDPRRLPAQPSVEDGDDRHPALVTCAANAPLADKHRRQRVDPAPCGGQLKQSSFERCLPPLAVVLWPRRSIAPSEGAVGPDQTSLPLHLLEQFGRAGRRDGEGDRWARELVRTDRLPQTKQGRPPARPEPDDATWRRR